MTSESLSRLLALIHRTSLEPALWSEAIQGITDAFAASTTGLVACDPLEHSFPFAIADPRASSEALEAYQDYYSRIDDLAAAMQKRTAGEVVTEEMVIGDGPLRRSEIWNDFYLRHDFAHHIGGYAINERRMTASLVIYRSALSSRFDDEDIRRMQLILPHVTIALRCLFKLRSETSRASVTTDALDMLAVSLMVVDERARLLWANASADRLLAERDGLSLDKGELIAVNGSHTAMLRRSIREAASSGELRPPRAAFSLPRTSGAGALPVIVSPVTRRLFGDVKRICMILIDRASAGSQGLERALREAWQLTPAEAAIAAALVAGESMQEISDRRAVSISTVRSQMKQIFAKTGTRRQADLVRLVLGGCGPTGRYSWH